MTKYKKTHKLAPLAGKSNFQLSR